MDWEDKMSPEVFVDILRDALFLVIMLVSAVIIPSLLVGLTVAVFQAATSINEQTLSFLPRLIVTLLSLIYGGHWLVQQLTDYTIRLIDSIPSVIG
jgi:flagellar biosynthetic protein FliQ